MANITVHRTEYPQVDLATVLIDPSLDWTSTGLAVHEIYKKLRDFSRDQFGKYYGLSFQTKELEAALIQLVKTGKLKMRIVHSLGSPHPFYIHFYPSEA